MGKWITTEAPCPLCGQFIAVDIMEGATDARKAELAQAHCTCAGAERKRVLDAAYATLDSVCGAESTQRGFDWPLGDDTIDALRRIATAMVDEELREAKLRASTGDEITIKSGLHGKVKVKRICKKQVEL